MLLATPSAVAAGPAADLVVYWSPGREAAVVERVRTTAQVRGAALIDRSPADEPAPEAPALLAAGIAAYDELRFDDADGLFDRALAACDHSGAAGLERDALADLLLYRGLTHIQRTQLGAWDELVAAARVDPTRGLDPARFPPRAIEQLARAREAVAAVPPARLEVGAPVGCVVLIDGANAPDGRAVVALGEHWVRTACDGHRPWGRRVTVDRDPVAITATPAVIAPPGDDDALIQARVAGASSVIELQVADGFARLRHRRLDGRELGRATVAMTGATPERAVADALARMLTKAGPAPRWYRSRVTWALAGAAVAAAVLIPVALADDGGPAGLVIRPTNWPPW